MVHTYPNSGSRREEIVNPLGSGIRRAPFRSRLVNAYPLQLCSCSRGRGGGRSRWNCWCNKGWDWARLALRVPIIHKDTGISVHAFSGTCISFSPTLSPGRNGWLGFSWNQQGCQNDERLHLKYNVKYECCVIWKYKAMGRKRLFPGERVNPYILSYDYVQSTYLAFRHHMQLKVLLTQAVEIGPSVC
jgi:hypothetical protein